MRRGDGPRRPRRDRPDGERRDRRDRPPRDDKARRAASRAADRRPGDGDRERRGPRPEGGDDRRRQRPHFTPPPELPQRPKPKRLRPGKQHRTDVLASTPEEQRPIAELALQGMAAVRQRLREDNARMKAEGKPEMPESAVMKMAEEMLPRLRVADWLDRAEAAQRQLEHLDLRDLRSVVAASDDPLVARDESTRELAASLKAALVTKQDEELALWLADVEAALDVGRVVRALRLSSVPPKAGVPFPGALATRLAEATTASLQPIDGPDRWAAVLEAAAFSPGPHARRPDGAGGGEVRRPAGDREAPRSAAPPGRRPVRRRGAAERAEPEAAAPDDPRRDAPEEAGRPPRARAAPAPRAGRREARRRGGAPTPPRRRSSRSPSPSRRRRDPAEPTPRRPPTPTEEPTPAAEVAGEVLDAPPPSRRPPSADAEPTSRRAASPRRRRAPTPRRPSPRPPRPPTEPRRRRARRRRAADRGRVRRAEPTRRRRSAGAGRGGRRDVDAGGRRRHRGRPARGAGRRRRPPTGRRPRALTIRVFLPSECFGAGASRTEHSDARNTRMRRGRDRLRTVGRMSEIVTYSSDGRVALITLNRPEARNAVNSDVANGLEAAIDRLEADDDVWVAILTGNTEGQANPVFCAGADLKAVNAGDTGLGTKRGGFAGFVYRERRKPVIVAVDGLATAGGCEIVLAADLVVATTRSSFGLAEVKRNLVAGAGGLFRLPRAIGQAAAMEAILTGEPIPAQRAYDLGLVSRLVEPGAGRRRGPRSWPTRSA